MQEIKKIRIVLASVLKPVDEPRMYERMGQSLATHGYEVYIIGSTPSGEANNQIQLVSHPRVYRLSLKRILVRLSIIKKILQIRPQLLIITTHELLGVAMIYWLLTGKKVIYDVQENYFKNVVHTHSFPKIVRHLIGFAVRIKEIMASVCVDCFFLAEKCYAEELSFVKKKYSIVENKCRLLLFQKKQVSDTINIIFSGTIAESTGVFQAIDLIKKLHRVNPKIKLTIIGYCQQPKVLAQIQKEVSNNSYIELIGGNYFVPHSKIVEEISNANFGLICYPTSPHTENKIPSKLYEYLSYQLPILLQNHQLWKEICEPFHAAILIDFNKPTILEIVKQMVNIKFYTTKPENVTWETEEPKFIETINRIVQ
ncbi:MAG: glycosyltransferase [Bacteroidetes bacterium]|nr:glycosyltransferase [Bacteroidota bacterium]